MRMSGGKFKHIYSHIRIHIVCEHTQVNRQAWDTQLDPNSHTTRYISRVSATFSSVVHLPAFWTCIILTLLSSCLFTKSRDCGVFSSVTQILTQYATKWQYKSICYVLMYGAPARVSCYTIKDDQITFSTTYVIAFNQLHHARYLMAALCEQTFEFTHNDASPPSVGRTAPTAGLKPAANNESDRQRHCVCHIHRKRHGVLAGN